MSFEFSDLNTQLIQGSFQNQVCALFTTQTACVCLSRPPTLHCLCLSNYVTIPCRCFSNIITYCKCLSRPILTIPCICLSKPIITGRPPTIRDFTIYEQVAEVTRQVSHVSELDLLRADSTTLSSRSMRPERSSRAVVQRLRKPLKRPKRS